MRYCKSEVGSDGSLHVPIIQSFAEYGDPHPLVVVERTLWFTHSQNKLAYWNVNITAQIYVCKLTGRLRCNFWKTYNTYI